MLPPFIKNQPYCCRTLVVYLWHTALGWDKVKGRKRNKRVFGPKSVLIAELYSILHMKVTD
jgi:hypothetical protein